MYVTRKDPLFRYPDQCIRNIEGYDRVISTGQFFCEKTRATANLKHEALLVPQELLE